MTRAPSMPTDPSFLATRLDAPLPDADGHLYVFGYGSLIWKPGFAHAGHHPALVRGYHRRFCLWSTLYRGTKEQPGLVLGLDRGGACRGVCFRVPAAQAAAVVAYLDGRENPSAEAAVYHRRMIVAQLLDSGRTVRALTYVVNRRHPQYCRPCAATAAEAIAHGVGSAGANRDYLMNTLAHLQAMGVRDPGLDRIVALLPDGGR